MTTLYKLTTQDNLTRKGESNETLWGPGVTHTAKLKGNALCSGAFIHAYTSPRLAILLNPIHANIHNPKLWECEGVIIKNNIGGNRSDLTRNNQALNVGCYSLTTIKELPVEELSSEQRIKFAILCAKSSCTDKIWNLWAGKWLEGSDRSAYAASRAAYAAINAVADSGDADNNAAFNAAFNAAYTVAYTVAYTAAADAIRDAADAANYAAKDHIYLDLIKISQEI